jgi:hypothetical protein
MTRPRPKVSYPDLADDNALDTADEGASGQSKRAEVGRVPSVGTGPSPDAVLGVPK